MTKRKVIKHDNYLHVFRKNEYDYDYVKQHFKQTYGLKWFLIHKPLIFVKILEIYPDMFDEKFLFTTELIVTYLLDHERFPQDIFHREEGYNLLKQFVRNTRITSKIIDHKYFDKNLLVKTYYGLTIHSHIKNKKSFDIVLENTPIGFFDQDTSYFKSWYNWTFGYKDTNLDPILMSIVTNDHLDNFMDSKHFTKNLSKTNIHLLYFSIMKKRNEKFIKTILTLFPDQRLIYKDTKILFELITHKSELNHRSFFLQNKEFYNLIKDICFTRFDELSKYDKEIITIFDSPHFQPKDTYGKGILFCKYYQEILTKLDKFNIKQTRSIIEENHYDQSFLTYQLLGCIDNNSINDIYKFHEKCHKLHDTNIYVKDKFMICVALHIFALNSDYISDSKFPFKKVLLANNNLQTLLSGGLPYMISGFTNFITDYYLIFLRESLLHLDFTKKDLKHINWNNYSDYLDILIQRKLVDDYYSEKSIKQKLGTGEKLTSTEILNLQNIEFPNKLENICNVCRVDKSNIVYNPCGHLSCVECAAHVSKCPICSNKIQSRIIIYG
jgi:hypothetical protein